MKAVEYNKEYEGEHPFELNGKKYVYCWGKYPNGKIDLAVYSFSNDIAYDYNDFRAENGISEVYKQPHTFMDINELEVPAPSPEEFQDDPTIGELLGKEEQDKIGQEAVMSQYDISEQLNTKENQTMIKNIINQVTENTQAPEAKEFMGTEKLQTASAENGLAGSVEKAEGDKIPEPTEIKTLLDRMKELTKILGNTPDIQWDNKGTGLTDAPKEVTPDEVVRSENETGAPKIETLKNPEAVTGTDSAPKTTSDSAESKSDVGSKESSTEDKKEDSKPDFLKKKDDSSEDSKEEPKEEEKKDDEEDKKVNEAIEEIHTHHIGAAQRNVAGGDPEIVHEEDVVAEDETVVGEDAVAEEAVAECEMTDEEIMETENTELMYESMVRYKNDPEKCLKFKRKIDEINKERRLTEAITKMRNRF